MNIIQKSLKTLASAFGKLEDSEVVLANGSIIDKRDVEDPTEKFHSMKPRQIVRNYRILNNIAFYAPEYDLPTIANAVQLDGLLQRSVNIFVEQILKNGYEITSKNDRLLRHINRRMKEIQQGTGISFYETMNNIGRQLVTYGNCFLIKVRSNAKSRYGNQYRLYGKNHNPIVGLFVADATTMSVGINKEGHVSNYRQNVKGRVRYWDERDVIHITYNKIPGTLTGMSSIVPVLDDVRALRKLEEEVEILGFQYSIPLYLYKVGTKDQPPAVNEIESVSATVNNMPSYGMLVVPGHHDITVPTNNNTPVDILAFVNHFKRRIYSGLGVSPIAMGEVECYDEDTLTLTESGWKRYTEIDKDVDKIATYNPETKGLEYHIPNLEHIRDYTGKMIHFTGKHVDIKVTPNHEMWIMIRHSGERKKVFAHELLDGKYPEFCFIDKIEECSESLINNTVCLDSKNISEIDLMYLAGWYVSEGCLDIYNASKGRYRTIISQKEPKAAEIRNILDRLDLSYSERLNKKTSVIDFRIYGKEMYYFMLDNFGHGSANKFLSDRFRLVTTDKAKVLVQTMMNGDGSWGKDNTGIYYTSSDKLRDDFMHLALTAGYQTKALGSYIGSYPGSSLPVHRISITDSDKDYRILTPDHVEEVDYIGKVYCYNVPNHLFITMRNGRIAIQGNTSNRNTSEVLDASMQTITKRYQQIIKNKIELELFRELLLDGGLNPSDTFVEFNFPEIDLEQQIKKENMILQKWQNNMISRTEARLEMDYERAVQDADTFLRLVEIPKIEAEGENQKDIAKISAQAAKVRANSAASKTTSSTNKKMRATTSANMPSNQHGTSSSRPKIKRDSIQEIYGELTDSLHNLLLSDGYQSTINKDKAANKIMGLVGPKLRKLISHKLTEIKDFYHLPVDEIDRSALDDYINDVRIILTDKVGRHISQINDDIKVGLFVDEIKDFLDTQEVKVDNFAKVLLYKSLGYKTILVDAGSCSRHTSINISSNDLSYLKIPPFRYGCSCSIDEKSFYEFQEI